MPENGSITRSSRFIDLDAAVDAIEPVRVKFRGEVIELPGDLPMEQSVRLMRAIDANNGGLIVEEAANLFGAEAYEKLAGGGIGVKTFTELVQKVMAMYGLIPGEGEDAPSAAGWGEAPDPQ